MAREMRDESEVRTPAHGYENDPLYRWWRQRTAGRCDDWTSIFAADVVVSAPDGRVHEGLDDWLSAYARLVNDVPLRSAELTHFVEQDELSILVWQGHTLSGEIEGAAVASMMDGRIGMLRLFEKETRTEDATAAAEDAALPDGNWWF